ncbi:hypothetical protein CDD82_5210 [Ophiocordyceps australis]|uniref:Uncharacterized protein n=1 Tax=Ophiocordyceps australis TaxID=1399860 RepID=A0A2C5ZS57_9HYPO|nr:hypothetical protein CDD82_5210 [Ophiocordyceps australis]
MSIKNKSLRHDSSAAVISTSHQQQSLGTAVILAAMQVFSPHLTTSSWHYSCGHASDDLKLHRSEIVMISNVIHGDPFEIDNHSMDWGAYILNLLPYKLARHDLTDTDRDNIREHINAEASMYWLLRSMGRLADWLFNRRETRTLLCWPHHDAMKFIGAFQSMTQGLMNIFTSQTSLSSMASGKTMHTVDVPGIVAFDQPHCVYSESPYFTDVATAVADIEYRLDAQPGLAKELADKFMFETLTAYQHPFLKALGESVLSKTPCTRRRGCVDFLTYGQVFAARDRSALLQAVRKALSNKLSTCIAHNGVTLSLSLIYIDHGDYGK